MTKDLELDLQSVTRAQLVGYGASRYQASVITRSLQSIGSLGRAYTYDLRQVIQAIRVYAAQPRTRLATKACLADILKQLTARLDNLVIFVAQQPTSEIGALAQTLLQTMHLKEQQLVELEAIAATHRGKREVSKQEIEKETIGQQTGQQR